MAWETCEWLVAKQRAQEMWSVKLFHRPSVASMAISSVTRLLNGLEQESKMATYSLYFTAVKMVIASFLSLPSLGNFCFLNADSGKRKFWKNVESWALESRIQLKESGIPLMFGIWNPSFTDKESRNQYLESWIHGVESRIQDGLGFSYKGWYHYMRCKTLEKISYLCFVFIIQCRLCEFH